MRIDIRQPGMFRAHHGAVSDRPFGPTTRATSAPPFALNTQAVAAGQQNVILPVSQQVVGTAETQIVSGQLPTQPISIAIPPATALEQTVFDLWASGDIQTTASGNITLKLYEGIDPTIANNVLLGSSGAIAQATLDEPFWVHATLIYSTKSGKLRGKIEFFVNNTLVAAVVLSNVVTGISNLNNPVASFSITITSSGATAGTPTTINLQKDSVG